MYNKNVTMNENPAPVVLESLPEGGSWVRLYKDAIQVETPEEGDAEPGSAWRAEEVVFAMPADRAETVESITESFDGWWEYGKSWTTESDTPPSFDERLAIMEETVNALIGM
jgi:hypothetical protein